LPRVTLSFPNRARAEAATLSEEERARENQGGAALETPRFSKPIQSKNAACTRTLGGCLTGRKFAKEIFVTKRLTPEQVEYLGSSEKPKARLTRAEQRAVLDRTLADSDFQARVTKLLQKNIKSKRKQS